MRTWELRHIKCPCHRALHTRGTIYMPQRPRAHVLTTKYTTCDLSITRLSTRLSTNNTHLLLTHGTAILSNQDIHQVRVPFTECYQNRCLALLQGIETSASGRWRGMHGWLITTPYQDTTWTLWNKGTQPQSTLMHCLQDLWCMYFPWDNPLLAITSDNNHMQV